MTPRQTRLSVLLITLATSAALTGAAARAAPPDARIVNGLYTHDYPNVGLLMWEDTPGNLDGAESWCTGTMIGCSTMLTAAHCVCDGDGPDCVTGGTMIPDPANWYVWLQHAGSFAVESVTVHPDYDFPEADLAVVRLAAPITGIRPATVNTQGEVPTGTDGTIVGFGRRGAGVYDYGLKRYGAIATSTCSASPADKLICWSYADPVGAPGEDSNTCEGDSGGPLFAEINGTTTLIGVTSGGNSEECTPTDYSFDVDLYAYQDWISSEAGADLGGASCGAIPQVGDAAVVVDEVDGSIYPASGTDEKWFSFTIPSGLQELRVAYNAHDYADDDVYVRLGAEASASAYDCHVSPGTSQYGECLYASPAAGTLSVMVARNSGAGALQITLTEIGAGSTCGGVPQGQACDDGLECTESDTCTESGCVGTAVTNGTACDDGSTCTTVDACSAGACVGGATPRADCTMAGSSGSSLQIKAGETESQDKIQWKWGKSALTAAAVGDPATDTVATLCLYDTTASTPVVILEQEMPSGAAWTQKVNGKGVTTWTYKDSAGSAGGLTALKAATGEGTKGKFAATLKGENVARPTLPLGLDPTVTAQLSFALASGGDTCLAARFTSATENSTAAFKAKSE